MYVQNNIYYDVGMSDSYWLKNHKKPEGKKLG